MDMKSPASSSADHLDWPPEGVTRVPYSVFTEQWVHDREQEQIFRGSTWNFLGLEVEIPDEGDYRITMLGDTQIIVVRGKAGAIHGLVNRCAHRGAMVCLGQHGNRKDFVCAYHNWAYNLDGSLIGAAFQKGINGKGGMPDGFNHAEHGLETIRVESFCGMIFGTFDRDMIPLFDFIGPEFRAKIERVLNRPYKLIGYHSQILHNNWKLYFENLRDSYHASLLHTFFVTFKLHRLTMDGGIMLDEPGFNHVSYSIMDQETDADSGVKLRAQKDEDELGLSDERLVETWQEFDDGITISMQTIFPTFALQQIHNVLGMRLMVPHGPDKSELISWMIGFEDDTDEHADIRMMQNNLIGPAGLVSMEDGCIGNFVQRGVRGNPSQTSFVEMGGHGTDASKDSRATETSIRAFWKAYRQVMDF